jgi:hypothetical protein
MAPILTIRWLVESSVRAAHAAEIAFELVEQDEVAFRQFSPHS